MDNLQRRPSESNAMMIRNRRCLSRSYSKLEKVCVKSSLEKGRHRIVIIQANIK